MENLLLKIRTKIFRHYNWGKKVKDETKTLSANMKQKHILVNKYTFSTVIQRCVICAEASFTTKEREFRPFRPPSQGLAPRITKKTGFKYNGDISTFYFQVD